MPIRSTLKNQNYLDLTKDQKDNIAKKYVRELSRKHILKDSPIISKDITTADLTGLSKLMRSNIALIHTLNDFIIGPVPYNVEPNAVNTFITTANKANFQFKEMINILDEYNNNEDIKKINPKDWDKATKIYDDLLSVLDDLFFHYWNLDGVNPDNERIEIVTIHLLTIGHDFLEILNEIDGSLRTFGGSVKYAGQRFYPEDTGVERKLL